MSLYEFLKENTWNLTEQWYADLDKTKDGVYGSNDPVKIERLKKQNYAFHELFCELFREDYNAEHNKAFEQWIVSIAKDQAHLATPIPEIIEEFLNVQGQYMQLIKNYIAEKNDTVSFAQYERWIDILVKGFKEIVIAFSRNNMEYADQQLRAQQEMITELSSPVIKLRRTIALLPLVGEIDTHRAQVIFTQTLEECVSTDIHSLLIDLSGVPVVDTMVANQLFSLIDGLKLVGTKASLSGVRPEIAQTSVQLGIDFSTTKIYSTIEQALDELLHAVPHY
ncbi:MULTISPECIES: STAS domain-containing protein [Shouchella]|uniref:STAS domain-containing protein n=2 Tax=Shouchella TaxID=2893057 RepID=A0ABY7WA19_9BACI|nr:MULTISPECIES: STAS domain-containing protein [Shouchella]MED4128735.1 STAS domain-containing protein [Shouchella miscanthi]WDF05767.1 STAS domain-containing protein [Shouchella hunanensis]GAF20491.1 RsbR, positive regulator of sigma-B [Bacillus sp. JCM 19047]